MTGILDTILFTVLGVMSLIILVGSAMPLWYPSYFKLGEWWRIRNKRLCDYESDTHLMGPLMDGLLDSEMYWATERKARRLQEIDERLCLTSKMSKRLQEKFKERYYPKSMQNVYKRALKTLRGYTKDRAYYGFDAEFDDLYQQALEIKTDDCLVCDNRGGRWLPEGAACQGFSPCTCKYRRD